MADLINITINDRKFQVPKGTLVIRALQDAGHMEVPHFCYHPKLKPVGMCRMCLVEIGNPKLGPDRKPVVKPDGTPEIAFIPQPQTACTMPVGEGMVVKSNTPAIEKAVAGVVEFFLANHPLDCPVCDKGGECPLQDQTFAFGNGASRVGDLWGGDVRLEQGIYQLKRHVEKAYPLSELVMLDRERCIQCARCTRFQDEIAHEHVLAFDERGSHMQIVSHSNPGFDSRFSGNTIDLCPVGALTNRVFRFKARVWELTNTPSVCNQCGCGCNIALGHRTNSIARIIPRDNEAINECWICDRGRFGHEFVEHAERITDPLVRKNGELVKTSWDEALQVVADQLNAIKSQRGASAIGGLASPKLTVEDNYVFAKLMREVIGTDNIDYRTDPRVRHTSPLLPSPNGRGAGGEGLYEQVENADVIVLVGADPLEELPILDLRLKKAISQKGAALYVINNRRLEISKLAKETLLVMPGGAASALDSLADKVSSSLRLVVLVGEATNDDTRAAARRLGEQVNRADHVHILAHEANSLGCLAAKCLPQNGGLTFDGMVAAANGGKLKAMFVLASNPIANYPNSAQVNTAFDQLEFLVVQDLFLTDTARRADVVLPGVSFAEKDGRLINFAGTVQTTRAALKPLGSSKPDWQILAALAARMGAEWSYRSLGDLVKEIGPFDEFVGRSFLTDTTQSASGTDADTHTSARPTNVDYPFTLFTGALLYDGGVTVSRNERLAKVRKPSFVEINRDDARTLGIASGSIVEVLSPDGMLALSAKVTKDVAPSTVFIPRKQAGADVRVLGDLNGTISVKVVKA